MPCMGMNEQDIFVVVYASMNWRTKIQGNMEADMQSSKSLG